MLKALIQKLLDLDARLSKLDARLLKLDARQNMVYKKLTDALKLGNLRDAEIAAHHLDIVHDKIMHDVRDAIESYR